MTDEPTHVPTTEMTRCLTRGELEYFIDLVGLDVTRVSEKLIIAHATAGDVYWQWNETISMFCHSMAGGVGA